MELRGFPKSYIKMKYLFQSSVEDFREDWEDTQDLVTFGLEM